MLAGDVPFHGENQVAVAMKHVREDLPDIQVRRPEVSASLASVIDRMTDKDLEHRYPDATSLVQDLEDVLAIEASRSGQATGEATAVLRTLPERARRRLPLRMRWRFPLLGLVLIGAVAAGALFLAAKEGAEHTERGTGSGKAKPQAGEKVVSVGRTSANDYDPQGDNEEHSDEVRLAVDRVPGTVWRTESYSGGRLFKRGTPQDGVGIYIDADPGVAAVRLGIDTPKTGWQAEIYGAADGPPDDLAGWTRVGGGTVSREEQRFPLDTKKKRYRYYLVWIKKLPKGSERVEIAEIYLFRRSS
jgi:serine/threonine-protein kinase